MKFPRRTEAPVRGRGHDRGAEEDNWQQRLTPPRLLLLVAVLVFVGETADMLLLGHLPAMPWFVLTLFDGAVLLVLLSPAYFWLYRPLKTHYYQRQRAEQEVAFLSRHILRAVEEEKKRIAHEMHDECGPILTAMQFDIETLKLSVIPQVPAAEQQFERLATMIAHLAGEVRSLTAQLRPVMLESCGLAPALGWHVGQVLETRPELQVDLNVEDCQGRYPAEIEIAVYRICQEGLNNIVSHSQATRASVAVHCRERIHIRIEDNGIGFDPRQQHVGAACPRGFGLLGMRERAAGLGGHLSVQSQPGQGTVIEVEMPVTIEEKEQ